MSNRGDVNVRPPFDQVLVDIADYVCDDISFSDDTMQTAYWCLLDSISCALMALKYEACTRLLGPIVPQQHTENGARVLGTDYQLDPVQAAFNNGTMIRWLDFNDTWLASEWGHPSDNFGALLAVCDYLRPQREISVQELLQAAIKAYEIQGIIALENSFNRVGLDHVVLVKLASTAMATHLMGGDKDTILNALSLAMVDGQALRTYRHAPNTGSRKSWAAGDATSRGVWLATMAMRGEMGYPSVLSASTWGFNDVLFDGKPIVVNRPYASYVMDNILFKIAYPAEFHGQTAVEAAIKLHPQVKDRLDQIDKITIRTQQSAMRIINKVGQLHNPADRDHSLQYMVAVGLIYGELTAEHYQDHIAADQRIDQCRAVMQVSEDKQFSKDYLDPDKRSIGNALQVFFNDGSHTEEISINYPLGHRQRRVEAMPLLQAKFQQSVLQHFSAAQSEQILLVTADHSQLLTMPITKFLSNFSKNT